MCPYHGGSGLVLVLSASRVRIVVRIVVRIGVRVGVRVSVRARARMRAVLLQFLLRLGVRFEFESSGVRVRIDSPHSPNAALGRSQG